MPPKPRPPADLADVKPAAPATAPRFVVARDSVGAHQRGALLTVADIPGGLDRALELVARGALTIAEEA